MTLADRLIPAILLVVCITLASWRLMNPPLDPKVSSWLEFGWLDLATGEYGYARDRFHGVLSVDPDNTEAKLGFDTLAVLGYPRMNRPLEKARQMILALLEVTPDNSYQQMLAGELAYRSGDYAKAEYHLDLALKSEPWMPRALYYRAKIYARQGQPIQAIAALEQALARLDEFPKRRGILVDLAHLRWRQGDLLEALMHYPELRELADGRDLDEQFEEARLLLQSGQLEKSLQVFENIVQRLEPNSEDTIKNLDTPWKLPDTNLGPMRSQEEKAVYLSHIQVVLQALANNAAPSTTMTGIDPRLYPIASTVLARDIEALMLHSSEYKRLLNDFGATDGEMDNVSGSPVAR